MAAYKYLANSEEGQRKVERNKCTVGQIDCDC